MTVTTTDTHPCVREDEITPGSVQSNLTLSLVVAEARIQLILNVVGHRSWPRRGATHEVLKIEENSKPRITEIIVELYQLEIRILLNDSLCIVIRSLRLDFKRITLRHFHDRATPDEVIIIRSISRVGRARSVNESVGAINDNRIVEPRSGAARSVDVAGSIKHEVMALGQADQASCLQFETVRSVINCHRVKSMDHTGSNARGKRRPSAEGIDRPVSRSARFSKLGFCGYSR